jgi:hypothetical protein
MGPIPKWHFVPRLPSGSLEISKVGIPVILGAHNFMCSLWLRWGLKQSFSPHQEHSNGLSHATFTWGNWGDSKLLMVGNQIGDLTPDPSFGHNLCLKCPNKSCKIVLNIWVPRAFQWYKKRLNPMGFDPCNYFLKIWESIGTSTPKLGAHLGVWGFIPSDSFTLPGTWNVTLELPSWPAPLQAFALVVNPKLELWHQGLIKNP